MWALAGVYTWIIFDRICSFIKLDNSFKSFLYKGIGVPTEVVFCPLVALLITEVYPILYVPVRFQVSQVFRQPSMF